MQLFTLSEIVGLLDSSRRIWKTQSEGPWAIFINKNDGLFMQHLIVKDRKYMQESLFIH